MLHRLIRTRLVLGALLLLAMAACTDLRREEKPPMNPLSSGAPNQAGNRP